MSMSDIWMNLSESVTEISEVLPPYFPPTTSSSETIAGLMLVVGICFGTYSGT